MASAPSPPAAAVFGSTGLVGSRILANLLAADGPFRPVHTIARRAAAAPESTAAAANAVVEADSAKWPAALGALAPAPAVVFSALGTTRAAAGGLANQWKIDHDLNIELARGAQAGAGASVFVFVSSAGTRGLVSSLAPYSRMKNGVEDALRDLAFDGGAVVLKPGMILGDRAAPRAVEGLGQALVRVVGRLSPALRDALGHDADVIARAAVRAAQLAAKGRAPSKFWVVEAADIIRLGRTEWPGGE